MITVFTPTYNRRECLDTLVRSLDKQTCKDFEWVVVDDGSTDGTEEYINSLTDKEYSIKYYKQENAGKHIAHNSGAEIAKGELFICVDSDDELFPDAVLIINSINDKFSDMDETIGYIFPRCGESDDRESWKKIDGCKIDVIDTKEIYGIIETAIVFKTDILKKYKFQRYKKCKEDEYERFCPEGILYNKLIGEGKFVAIDREIYKYEYKSDGLTNNLFKLWINNSCGVIDALRVKYVALGKYKFFHRAKSRMKCIININAICLTNHMSLMNNTPSKLYSVVLYLPSIVFVKKRFRNNVD